MNNLKKYTALIIIFLITINIFAISPINGEKFNLTSTIVVPDDYEIIQEAINNARKGDTIYIKNGTYYENLIIEQSIKLIGEDKNTTIIDGFQNQSVIKILSDNVFINDLTIKNSSKSNENSAIEIYSKENYIVRNIIKNNLNGINTIEGNNNTIMYNSITNNQNNSIIINTPYNTIYRNQIEENNIGIFLNTNATKNTIKQNNLINNNQNAEMNKARSNEWDQNYWDDWIGIQIVFLKFLPKLIKSNYGIIPTINFDWHPSQEKYLLNAYPIAIIETNMGTMTLELYTDKMPITTDNFIKLSNDGFFENIVFHRVIDDFVIQGGGYYANGTNKRSPYGTIKLETHPDVLHIDGAISMARTFMPNSATSQFFICDGPSPHLDGNYAAFGVIIDGIDVLRAIAEVETTTKYGLEDWPVEDVIINSITIEYL